MGKKGLTQEGIVTAAARLVEEKGLENITLHELAGALDVKTASLYNHLNGLPELSRKLAQLGLEQLDCALQDAALGRRGEDALMEVALAYRRFALTSPQLYKAICSCKRLEDEALEESGRAVARTVFRVLERCGLHGQEATHLGRALRSAMHGFVSLEEAGFFKASPDADESYRRMMKLLLSGLGNSFGKEQGDA